MPLTGNAASYLISLATGDGSLLVEPIPSGALPSTVVIESQGALAPPPASTPPEHGGTASLFATARYGGGNAYSDAAAQDLEHLTPASQGDSPAPLPLLQVASELADKLKIVAARPDATR